jgi:hypothetical protein
MEEISAWAAKLAEEKKQQRKREREHQAKILSDRELIEALGDGMWSQVRQT